MAKASLYFAATYIKINKVISLKGNNLVDFS